MPNSKALGEKIYERQQIICGHKSRIRCAITTTTNDAFFERSVKRNNEVIKQLQLANARLYDERDNSADIIEHSTKRIQELKAEIALLEHGRAIQLVLELQRSLNELVSES